jgi:molybdopterin synthase catalytic subunit
MANPVCELLFTKAELEEAADWPENSCGAIVDFRGIVRGEEQGRNIRGIDYEAHPSMAEHQLQLVARGAMERFGLEIAVIRHRVGFVAVGEASLFARVAAPHRREAIEAMEWLVDELKKRVPIWKHPEFELNQPIEPAPGHGTSEISPK